MLFDLDGVLVHSTQSIESAWQAWAAGHNLAWETVRPHVHGRHAVDTIRALLGDLADADIERQAQEVMWRQVSDTSELSAVAGMPDLVAAVSPGRWAVVTACSHELAVARLRATGYPVPDVLVTVDDGVAGKPDPAGYRLAADRLGASGRYLVIEDTAAGVAAGKAAGMAVIGLLTTHDPSALAAADVVVPDGRWLSATIKDGSIVVELLSTPEGPIRRPIRRPIRDPFGGLAAGG